MVRRNDNIAWPPPRIERRGEGYVARVRVLTLESRDRERLERVLDALGQKGGRDADRA